MNFRVNFTHWEDGAAEKFRSSVQVDPEKQITELLAQIVGNYNLF